MMYLILAYLMPGFVSWIGPAIGLAGSVFGGSDGGGGGATGGGPGYYTPTGLAGADSNWQNAFNSQYGLANTAYGAAQPAYQGAFNNLSGMNYAPYAAAGQRAGAQMQGVADLSGRQADMYGAGAQRAADQQGSLYGAANNIWMTALDPQNALRDRTQNAMFDKVRSGQAMRGLGNSAVGAQMENDANRNFLMDWQDHQLSRQSTGAQAMGALSYAGGGQGQLQGANLTGQMNASAAQPGYTMQAGQLPIQAQQWAYQQPAAAASSYNSYLQGLGQNYGNVNSAALPYMNQGQGAQQAVYNNAYKSNNDVTTGFGQLGSSVGKAFNDPGSWLSKAFGGKDYTGYSGQTGDWRSMGFGGEY